MPPHLPQHRRVLLSRPGARAHSSCPGGRFPESSRGQGLAGLCSRLWWCGPCFVCTLHLVPFSALPGSARAAVIVASAATLFLPQPAAWVSTPHVAWDGYQVPCWALWRALGKHLSEARAPGGDSLITAVCTRAAQGAILCCGHFSVKFHALPRSTQPSVLPHATCSQVSCCPRVLRKAQQASPSLCVKLQGSRTKSKGLSTCPPPPPRPPAGSSYPSHTGCQPPPPSCAVTQRQMSVRAEQAQHGGDGWQFNDVARHCLANAISRAAGGSQADCPTAAPLPQLRFSSSSCAAQLGWEGFTALPLGHAEIPIPGVPVQWLEQAHPPLPCALLW